MQGVVALADWTRLSLFDYSSFNLGGYSQEIIIYPSDQSQNRTRIETNINQYYNIYWNGTKAGILDSYPSSAAAYSLRALSSTYTGPLVRVRRASDNVESDFYALYDGGLDVIGLSNFCVGTDGFVATWYDQSGNNRHQTQATATKQAKIVEAPNGLIINPENGKPSLLLDGTDDGYSTTMSIPIGTTLNLISVLKTNDPDGILYWDISNRWTFILQSGSSSTNRSNSFTISNVYKNSVLQTLPTRNDYYLAFGNNVTHLSFMQGVVALSDWTRLSLFDYSSLNLGGYSQEIIIYSSDQSQNRAKIESNINRYYNIYWDGSVKGVLDSYPNSAAAYSLRALSSRYTGPLIKIRRASDNLENDIYATYNGDLDVKDLTDFCSGTNGFVTVWYDQSGNGRNAVQTTASNQPQIVASGSVILEGGKPTILFDGVDDELLQYYDISRNYLIFVLNSNHTTDNRLISSQENFSSNVNFLNIKIENYLSNWYNGSWNTITSNSILINNQYILHINKLEDRLNTFLNSLDITINNNVILNNNTNVSIGGKFKYNNLTAASGKNFAGKMQEIIMYSTNQNSNRLGIENNINRYYNIY
jgi:hypothetical protein